MAQQQDTERRLEVIEKDIDKIEKAIWGNGTDGMKDRLNTVYVQQKLMLKLGWLFLTVTITQVLLAIFQFMLK